MSFQLRFAFAIVTLVAWCSVASAQDPQFTAQRLAPKPKSGVVSSASDAVGVGVNRYAVFVGYATGSDGKPYGYAWDRINHVRYVVPPLTANYPGAEPTAINNPSNFSDSTYVCGQATNTRGNADAFVWKVGASSSKEIRSTTFSWKNDCHAINDNEVVAGEGQTSNNSAMTPWYATPDSGRTSWTCVEIVNSAGSRIAEGYTYGLNNSRAVCGYYIASSTRRPFRCNTASTNKTTELSRGGYTHGEALSINNAGWIVGTVYNTSSDKRMAIWSPSNSLTVLGSTHSRLRFVDSTSVEGLYFASGYAVNGGGLQVGILLAINPSSPGSSVLYDLNNLQPFEGSSDSRGYTNSVRYIKDATCVNGDDVFSVAATGNQPNIGRTDVVALRQYYQEKIPHAGVRSGKAIGSVSASRLAIRAGESSDLTFRTEYTDPGPGTGDDQGDDRAISMTATGGTINAPSVVVPADQSLYPFLDRGSQPLFFTANTQKIGQNARVTAYASGYLGTSVEISISAPVPSIGGISPNAVYVDQFANGIDITVSGSGLFSGAEVSPSQTQMFADSSELPTWNVTSSGLTATLGGQFQTVARTVPITAHNAWGGGDAYASFSVLQNATQIQVESSSLTRGAPNLVRARVITNNNWYGQADVRAVSGAMVRFLLNGVEVGSGVSTSDGWAQLTFTVNNSATLGQATITAIFDGIGGRYLASSALQTVSIVQPTPVTLNGTVSLEDYARNKVAGTTVSVEIYDGSTLMHQANVELQAFGGYSLTVPVRGTLDVRFKASHWLARKIKSVVVSDSGATASPTLANGDVDGSNFVGTDDYLLLNASFDLSSGQTGFDQRADLNGDGYVGTDDYLILNINFDKAGD